MMCFKSKIRSESFTARGETLLNIPPKLSDGSQRPCASEIALNTSTAVRRGASTKGLQKGP